MGFKYAAGQKFNRMTLIEPCGCLLGKWVCECDCGTTKEVPVYDVKRGRIQSCGCLLHDGPRRSSGAVLHGMTLTPIYGSWLRMRSDAVAGGSGMAEHWATFEGFHEDMGGSYREGHSLRRIDKALPFRAENCKWFYKGRRHLSVEQVRAIRRSGSSNTELSKEHGVRVGTIYDLRRGKTYLDVT